MAAEPADIREWWEKPRVTTVNLNGLTPRDVTVHYSNNAAWADFGAVAVFGEGETPADQLRHLAAVGEALTARANEALVTLRERVA